MTKPAHPRVHRPRASPAGPAEGINPYRIAGPACISFSGGRTSGYMLRRIVDAYGGTLPDDVLVCFANTGKEREETLDFVHRVERAWAVTIHWVEFKRGTIDYAGASRNGEPYEALVTSKAYLPNAVTRFCTTELKVLPIKRFMLSRGIQHWTMVLGLRADEPRRVSRARQPNKEQWDTACPLASAGATVETVRDFWRGQPFDLQLAPHEGNCDLCFLKGRGKLADIIRTMPDRADWWIAQEDRIGATFRKDRLSYRMIRDAALAQREMFDEPMMAECFCHD